MDFPGKKGCLFRFQSRVCDDCHDLVQKSMNFNDLAVISVKGNNYRIHFSLYQQIK